MHYHIDMITHGNDMVVEYLETYTSALLKIVELFVEVGDYFHIVMMFSCCRDFFLPGIAI